MHHLSIIAILEPFEYNGNALDFMIQLAVDNV